MRPRDRRAGTVVRVPRRSVLGHMLTHTGMVAGKDGVGGGLSSEA